MKNGNDIHYLKNDNFKCPICNCENININLSKIRNNKLKKLLSNFEKDKLINKCKCSNDEKKVHKICLLINIIYNFEIKCRLCKNNYNIKINKSINNSKKLCKLFSYLFLTLFHIILFAASVLLIIYKLVIKKKSDNLESKKFDHLSIFFGITLFLINLLLILITYSNFIDKNEIDIYDYNINVFDEEESNKINTNSDKFYSLLYDFYRYFHNSRTRYLISKNFKSLFFLSGHGNYNKDIDKLINENNEEIEKDIIKEEQNKKRAEIKGFHYTGTLGNFKQYKNEDNEKNSYEKNSKNTNPINLQLSLIKKEYEENNSHRENIDDILIINKHLNKKSEKKSFNSISIYSNKKYNIISKSCYYKKIDQNKLLLKSRTYKTKSDRKKNNKENNIINNRNIKNEPKKFIKINDSESEKKYVDSTFLLKNEKDKEKKNDKNNNS